MQRRVLSQIGVTGLPAGVGARRELCCESEGLVDCLTLSTGIALIHPADLTFEDCVHRLVTFDGSPLPSAERKPRWAEIRFLMKRWYCWMVLFRKGAVRQRQRRPSSTDSFNSSIASG